MGCCMAKVKAKVRKQNAETDSTSYVVRLDGTRQGAVIVADSPAQAREKFCELFGIISTSRKIKVAELEEDSDFDVDANGVINPLTID